MVVSSVQLGCAMWGTASSGSPRYSANHYIDPHYFATHAHIHNASNLILIKMLGYPCDIDSYRLKMSDIYI
jgi:hypothetical protein